MITITLEELKQFIDAINDEYCTYPETPDEMGYEMNAKDGYDLLIDRITNAKN